MLVQPTMTHPRTSSVSLICELNQHEAQSQNTIRTSLRKLKAGNYATLYAQFIVTTSEPKHFADFAIVENSLTVSTKHQQLNQYQAKRGKIEVI